MMKQLARLKFSQNSIKVPDKFQQPQGEAGDHYNKAFKPEEKVTTPAMTVPPLFTPHTMNKYNTDVQKMLTDKIGKYMDGICTAICSAWSQWQSMATLVGVNVMGPTAMGGNVVGPPWMPLILASAPMSTPQEMKFSKTIAQVISNAWQQYQSTIKVMGMPWYPMFAAVPSPVAPPTPNIPCPVQALMQVPVSLMPMTMCSQMKGQHGDPQAMYHKEIFDAVCDAFDKCFTLWKTSTMVTNVLGTGPVPTFAPPYVPVGPVMGGVANMTPGGFV